MEIVEDILDEPCKQLLREIQSTVPVKFTQWNNNHYASQLHKNNDDNPREAEAFFRLPLEMPKIVHELLHMKVDLIMGDNSCMLSIPDQYLWYTQIVNRNGAAQILNACQHVIFFPDYLKMGYADEDSFQDKELSDGKKADFQELSKMGVKINGLYNINKVVRYIALEFSMDFYPNEKRYRKELKALKQKEYPLYCIIHDLRKKCTNLPLEVEYKECLQEAYFEFAIRFNDWLKKVPMFDTH